MEDAEQARRRFLTRLAHSLQWDAKNWAYTHQGLLSRLGMQIAGAGQRLQEMVQAANLAVLNTIEGYGHVFERLMDGWEGEVLTIVKDLQEEGEAAVSAGRTDGHLRVVQAILAAEKLCADTKEVRDRVLKLRRVLVKTQSATIDRTPTRQQEKLAGGNPTRFKSTQGATIDRTPTRQEEEAWNLISLAQNLIQLGRYEEAMAMLKEVHAVATEVDGKFLSLQAISGIGNVHEALGKGPEALEAYEEALSLAQEIFEGGDHEVLAKIYWNVGQACSMCEPLL